MKRLINNIYDKPYIGFCLLYLLLLSSFLQVKITGGDDTKFKNVGETIPYSEVIFNWDARITSNLFGAFILEFNLILWKIFTPLLVLLLIYSLSRTIIWDRTYSRENKIKLFVFLFLIYWYIYPMVIISSLYWVVGSISYMWPVTMGIFSFLHFIKFYINQKVKNWKIIFFYLTSAYAAFGHEQISLLLSVFSLLFIGYFFILRNKKPGKEIVFQTLIYVVGTIFMATYGMRYANDTSLYYPDFDSITLYEKIFRGSIWLLNHFFFKEKFLMIFLLLLLFYYNINSNSNKFGRIFLSAIYALPIIILSLSVLPIDTVISTFAREIPHNYGFKINDVINSLISFNVRKYTFDDPFELLKYLFWLFYLLFIPLGLLLKKSFLGINGLVAIIILASYGTASVMFFAPSIYESKHRVFLLPVLLIIIAIGFLIKTLEFDKKLALKHFALLSIYPIIIYLLLQWQWSSGFYIMH